MGDLLLVDFVELNHRRMAVLFTVSHVPPAVLIVGLHPAPWFVGAVALVVLVAIVASMVAFGRAQERAHGDEGLPLVMHRSEYALALLQGPSMNAVFALMGIVAYGLAVVASGALGDVAWVRVVGALVVVFLQAAGAWATYEEAVEFIVDQPRGTTAYGATQLDRPRLALVINGAACLALIAVGVWAAVSGGAGRYWWELGATVTLLMASAAWAPIVPEQDDGAVIEAASGAELAVALEAAGGTELAVALTALEELGYEVMTPSVVATDETSALLSSVGLVARRGSSLVVLDLVRGPGTRPDTPPDVGDPAGWETGLDSVTAARALDDQAHALLVLVGASASAGLREFARTAGLAVVEHSDGRSAVVDTGPLAPDLGVVAASLVGALTESTRRSSVP